MASQEAEIELWTGDSTESGYYLGGRGFKKGGLYSFRQCPRPTNNPI